MYYKRRKKVEKSKAEFLYELICVILVVAAIIYAAVEGRGGNIYEGSSSIPHLARMNPP